MTADISRLSAEQTLRFEQSFKPVPGFRDPKGSSFKTAIYQTDRDISVAQNYMNANNKQYGLKLRERLKRKLNK